MSFQQAKCALLHCGVAKGRAWWWFGGPGIGGGSWREGACPFRPAPACFSFSRGIERPGFVLMVKAVFTFIRKKTSSGAEEPGSKQRSIWLLDVAILHPQDRSTSEGFPTGVKLQEGGFAGGAVGAQLGVQGVHSQVCRGCCGYTVGFAGLQHAAPAKGWSWSPRCPSLEQTRVLGVPSTRLRAPQGTSSRTRR